MSISFRHGFPCSYITWGRNNRPMMVITFRICSEVCWMQIIKHNCSLRRSTGCNQHVSIFYRSQWFFLRRNGFRITDRNVYSNKTFPLYFTLIQDMVTCSHSRLIQTQYSTSI
jgi:hypothetical protein